MGKYSIVHGGPSSDTWETEEKHGQPCPGAHSICYHTYGVLQVNTEKASLQTLSQCKISIIVAPGATSQLHNQS